MSKDGGRDKEDTALIHNGMVAHICLSMQETWVPSLCQEGPLEEGMATHSTILSWRIPWTEEPGGGGLQSIGSQRVHVTKPSEHAHKHNR